MKSRRITYRIPEPCHEGWENMTPVAKGRFCSTCAKPVVDFSRMADWQIHQVMESSTGSVCGRMTVSQINRPMIAGATTTPAFSLHALVLGTALTTFSAIQAFGQRELPKTEQTQNHTRGEVVAEPVLMGDVAPEIDSTLSGKVIDYLENRFIAGTSVTLYDEAGKEIATILTNDKGEFELPLKGILHPHHLIFRKEEYTEAYYLIADFSSITELSISMYRREQMIEGLIDIEKR